MNLEEIKIGLQSDNDPKRREITDYLGQLAENNITAFEEIFQGLMEFIPSIKDEMTVLPIAAMVRDTAFTQDQFNTILSTLDAIAEIYPMLKDEDIDSAIASNLFQAISASLSSDVAKFKQALPVLLKYLRKPSYVRGIASGPIMTFSMQQPKLLAPHAKFIFGLVKDGYTEIITPLMNLYQQDPAVFEDSENIAVLVNISKNNPSYAGLALNIINEISKKKPELIVPSIPDLKQGLSSMTTASSVAMIFTEIARKAPEAIEPYISDLIEAGENVPYLNMQLPPILGTVGRQSIEAAQQILPVFDKYLENADQNLLIQVLSQIKGLAELDRALLDPYIEKIRTFSDDPAKYVRDQANLIIDFYDGKDLSSLMANYETLNEEIKNSVSSIEDMKNYVDDHVAELKEFLAEVSKKLPIPTEFSSEGRLRKTLKLHFSCGCTQDRCLFPADRPFFTETKELNKWLKVAVSAVKLGTSVASASAGDAISNVKDIYKEATGEPDENFLAIVNEPFITSAEQDYLVNQLRDARYFDFFNYNAQSANWCCMMCQPPSAS